MATPSKDVRSSLYFPPESSNRSYLAQEAIRSGNRDPVDSRESEFQRYAGDLRDPVEREKEKDRIRAEIMAEQAERRRILEDEIRTELMLERQVAVKRWELSKNRFDNPLQVPPSLHDPVRVRSDAPPETRPFPFVHQPSIRISDASESRQFVDERSRIVASESRQLVDERSRIMRTDAPSANHQFAHDSSRLHSDAPSAIHQFAHDRSRLHSDAPSAIHQFAHDPSRLHSDAPSAIHQFAHDRSRLHSDASSGIRPFVHEPQRIPQSSSYLEDRRMFLTMLPSHRVAGDRFMASSGYQHHPMLPTTSNLVLLDAKPAHSEIRRDGILGSFPYQQHQMPPSTLSMPRKERNLLENREEYISDLIRKRKASALGTDHYRKSNLEKKPKEEWRCDLCKVVASSKRNLKDHMYGKKHKLMVEEIRNPVKKEPTLNTDAIKIETSCAPSTMVNEKQNIVTGGTLDKVETVLDKMPKSKTDEPSSSEAATAEKKQNSVKDSKAAVVVKKKRIARVEPPSSKAAKVEPPSSKAAKVEPPSSKAAKVEPPSSSKAAMVDKKQTKGVNGAVKSSKFWCGICQVGVTSQKTLFDHEKGKKHMENLQEKAKVKP